MTFDEFDATVVVRALLAGYSLCLLVKLERERVPAAAYRVHRLLQKRGAVSFEAIASRLPRD
jgi:hypothetical protein